MPELEKLGFVREWTLREGCVVSGEVSDSWAFGAAQAGVAAVVGPRLALFPAGGDNEPVERKPMMAKIPPDGDAAAEEIIELARGGVTEDLLGCLVKRDFAALSGYGTRHSIMALREGSAERLHRALLAEAIFAAGCDPDDRLVMVSLALYFYIAEQVGLVPADLFDQIASYLPDGPWPDLIRWFGTRDDIILEAFAWERAETPDGPDFISTL